MSPIGLEVEFAIGMGETVKVVRGTKIGLEVTPQLRLESFNIAVAALFQGGVDQFTSRHFEPGMDGIQAASKALQPLMIGATLARRIDQLGTDRNMLVAAAVIEIVMLHEHGRRQ